MKKNFKNNNLKADGIRKNSSTDISHSIKKIKENEKKYTVILVLFFMVVFCFVGYFTLSVNGKSFATNFRINNTTSTTNDDNEISAAGQTVSLISSNAVSDSLALSSNDYVYNYTVGNNSNYGVNYNVVLVKDDYTTSVCGCSDNSLDISNIKYSVDGVNIGTFNADNDGNLVISSGVLDSNSSETLEIRIWVNENTDNSVEKHFHGYLTLKEVNI
jgi:hypothetical protein